MTTPLRLPLACAVATAAALCLPVSVATAQQGPVEAGTTAESWYRPPPPAQVCTALPVGCPAAGVTPPSQYPAGTLHVGVLAGVEESRTYLTLDLSGVPADSALSGGTLSLPVSAAPGDGTSRPETAKVRACAVSGMVPDRVEGGVDAAPQADCATASPGTFVPGTDTAPATVTVDLAPFAALWSGQPDGSLAIVPAEDVAPPDAWHLAFSRRDRQAEGAVPIRASLLTSSGAPAPSEPAPVPEPEVVFDGSLDTGSSDTGASFATPPLAAVAASDPLSAPVAPNVATPQQQQSVPVAAAVFGGPFAYPAVFLLPLLVAVAGGWAGRAFTRELVPART